MADTSVSDLCILYEQAKALRLNHEEEWRRAAMYCLPAQYANWYSAGPTPYSGPQVARRQIYDTTGMRSLPKYASVLERLATPAGQVWHTLVPSDESLRRKRPVREYFEDTTKLLFKMRYHPAARFRTASGEVYTGLGVYGNAPIFIGERKATIMQRQPGLKYVPCHIRDCFVLVDDEGNVYAFFRRFWLNVRQFKMKFPDAPIPSKMQAEANKPVPDEGAVFEFFHYVGPRSNETYDPTSLSARRHPMIGRYVEVSSKEFVGDEHGYTSMPYKFPRTATVTGDPYGYSPASLALASMGGANAIKKVNLKHGNRAADPTLLAHDDALHGEVDLRPGAVNYGGVNRQGQKMIQALETGNFRVAEALLSDERGDVEDCFFVTLFQILNDTPEMTATEVMERVAEKASLLSPTMGRLQSEFLGPGVERELEVLHEMGLLPEMPPELVEAQGEYEVQYSSPLAKSMYAEEVGGFMRTVELAMNTSKATGDPSHLDHFNFDAAYPEIADHLAVPARWMNDINAVRAKRDGRADQAQQDQLMSNAGGLAAAAKTVNDMGAGQ